MYMKIFLTSLFFSIPTIVVYFLGFRHGIYYERKAWNDLIAKGILPSPDEANYTPAVFRSNRIPR